MNEATCRGLSEFISVLSNAHRIRILCVLAHGEHNVGGIARAVELPPAHVSSHLRVLYDRGYVRRRRQWKEVYYSLRDPQVKEFIDLAMSLAGGPERGSPESRGTEAAERIG